MTKNICIFGFEKYQKRKPKNFQSSEYVSAISLDFLKFFVIILFISQFNYIDSLQYMYYPGFRQAMPSYSFAQTPAYYYPSLSLSHGRLPAYSPRVQYVTPPYNPYQSQPYYSYPYQTKVVPVASNYVQNPLAMPVSQNPEQTSMLLETLKNLISKTNPSSKTEILDTFGVAKEFDSKQIDLIKSADLEKMSPTDRQTSDEFIKGYKAALADIAKRVKMSEKLQETAGEIKSNLENKMPSSVFLPPVFVNPSSTSAQVENQKLSNLHTSQAQSPHQPSFVQQGLPSQYPYPQMMYSPGYQIPFSPYAPNFIPPVKPEDVPSREETAHHRSHRIHHGHHGRRYYETTA